MGREKWIATRGRGGAVRVSSCLRWALFTFDGKLIKTSGGKYAPSAKQLAQWVEEAPFVAPRAAVEGWVETQ